MAATSPSSHRRRHGSSTNHSGGGHTRSSLVLSSSTPFSGQHASPSTFAIPSSAILPNVNPLLQPDVTSSSLLSQYTPQQLTGHLNALRQDLRGYEAEMKRLINSRYGDILSVGGTISAMRGSSVSLHQKLAQVSVGLKQSGSSTNRPTDETTSLLIGSNTEHRGIRNIAALLSIQQEAPEEIWSVLDSVYNLANQVPAQPTAERLATLLKCARSLSTAVSLYDALRLAGWHLDASSNSWDIPRLFPYPLVSRNSTLSSIKGEIRSALEHIVEASTSTDGARLPTQSGKEVTFRLTALALLGLVRLNALQPKEVGRWYLGKQRKKLQKVLQASSHPPTEARLDVHRMLAELLGVIEETIINHSRLFGCSSITGSTLFGSLLLELMAGSSHLSLGEAALRQASEYVFLLPPHPFSALSLVSNSSQVLEMLDEDSGVKDWTPFFELGETNDREVQSQQEELTAWVHSVLAEELSLQQGFWATSFTLENAACTLGGISCARKQLSQCVHPLVASREDGAANEQIESTRLIRTSYRHIDVLLSVRALAIARTEIENWNNNVLKQLKVLLTAAKHNPAHTLPYEELFLSVSTTPEPEKHGDLSTSSTRAFHPEELDMALSGLTMHFQPYLNSLLSEWAEFEDSKKDYFDACYGEEGTETEQEKQERRQWTQAEVDSWVKLSSATLRTVEDFRDTEQADGGSRRAVQLLCQALQSIVKLLSSRDSTTRDAEDFDEVLGEMTSRLSRSEDDLLSGAWKQSVVAHAGAMLLSTEGHDSAAGRQTASPRLLKALHYLDAESGKVIPLAGRQSKEVCPARKEVGSMPDLLADLLRWLSIKLEEDASFKSRLEQADLETLAALVVTNPRGHSSDSASQDVNMKALSSLRSHAQSDTWQARDVELLSALSPYALLFGRIVGVPLPSATVLRQRFQEAASDQPGPTALFAIAPVSARIRTRSN